MNCPPRYALRAHLRLVLPSVDEVFLIGEHERHLWRGPEYYALLPLLREPRTFAELLAELRAVVPQLELRRMLGQLAARGVLDESRVLDESVRLPRSQASFWHGLGVDAQQLAVVTREHALRVESLGAASPAPFAEALARLGFPVNQGAARGVVLLVDDYLAPEVAPAFARFRAGDEAYAFVVKPGGRTLWAGPLFARDAGACWECLRARLLRNRPVEAYLARRAGPDLAAPLAPQGATECSLRIAAEFAALTLLRGLTGVENELRELLLTFDLADWQRAQHRILRRPQCPACGDPSLGSRDQQPLTLCAQPKRFVADGGHRVCTPEQTYARCAHLISPITGVVASLGPLPERDQPGFPVYGATYFVEPRGALQGPDPFSRPALGKGRSAAQARVSALAEAIERANAVFQGDEPTRVATHAELAPAAVDPRSLLQFSATQYRERSQDRESVHSAPEPYDPERLIRWSAVWSLTRQRLCYLPTSYCFSHVPETHGMWHFSTNGHAAGNCLEEAALQGLLELVERDAAAIWWYNRIARPEVELASFDQPYFQQVQRFYGERGLRLCVFDLTHDVGIPVFVALARHERGQYAAGFGAHLSASLAIQRALTELQQIYDPSGRHPALFHEDEVQNHPFLSPSPALAKTAARDFPESVHDDLRDDLLWCVARLAELGLETLLLDYSRPDIPMSTVKVTVPGLRHFWRWLGPGRLYEAPVTLGWCSRPKRESELNPKALLL